LASLRRYLEKFKFESTIAIYMCNIHAFVVYVSVLTEIEQSKWTKFV